MLTSSIPSRFSGQTTMNLGVGGLNVSSITVQSVGITLTKERVVEILLLKYSVSSITQIPLLR